MGSSIGAWTRSAASRGTHPGGQSSAANEYPGGGISDEKIARGNPCCVRARLRRPRQNTPSGYALGYSCRFARVCEEVTLVGRTGFGKV